MTRAATPLNTIVIHRHRDRADDTCVDATFTAWARYQHQEAVDVWAEVQLGPGLGPHYVRDTRTLRRWAWAMHHLADALDQAAGPPEPRLPDGHIAGQLTIDDLEGVNP